MKLLAIVAVVALAIVPPISADLQTKEDIMWTVLHNGIPLEVPERAKDVHVAHGDPVIDSPGCVPPNCV